MSSYEDYNLRRDSGFLHREIVEEDLQMASREAVGLYKELIADGRKPLPLIGNGAQQGFATGATRSTSEGKIDYEGHIHPEVLAVFGEYMNRHRVQRDGNVRASDNWQEGIPVYRYVKSLIRHTFEFWRMWRGTPVINPDNGQYFTFEDVLSAILFNVMGIIYEFRVRLLSAHSPWLRMTHLSTADRKGFERVDQEKDYANQRQAQQTLTRAQLEQTAMHIIKQSDERELRAAVENAQAARRDERACIPAEDLTPDARYNS